MTLAAALERFLPGWMRRPSTVHWSGLMGALALTVDAVIEGLYQGRQASMPMQVRGGGVVGLGGFDTLDALPLIGRDRRIVQGLYEDPVEYAAALRAWRTPLAQTAQGPRAGWIASGTPFGLLTQLRRVMASAGNPPPVVRMVNRQGVWHTIEADGSLVLNTADGTGFRLSPAGDLMAEPGIAHPWDWDSSTPTSDGYGDDFLFWLIVYAPIPVAMADDNPDEDEPDPSLGTSATFAYVESARGLVDEWKTAGVICNHIIIAFDASSFGPLTAGPYPAAGMPDGYWGLPVKIGTVGGSPAWVPSRLDTARYWKGHY